MWWDPRSGFARTLVRFDGHAYGDWVQQLCLRNGPKGLCIPPSPFDLKVLGPAWPPKAPTARIAGTGTFRGHRVVWVEGMVQPGQGEQPYRSGSKVAYESVTHRPLALKQSMGKRGRPPVWLRAINSLPNIDPKQVAFVVPDGGADLNAPSPDTQIRAQGLAAARQAVGATPLWLGRSFQGHELSSIVVGNEAERYQDGRRLNPARFASFDYGSFSVQEFGRSRPFGEEGPADGTVFLDGRATLNRDGVLVVVQPSGPKFRLDRARALALVKALRPVDD